MKKNHQQGQISDGEATNVETDLLSGILFILTCGLWTSGKAARPSYKTITVIGYEDVKTSNTGQNAGGG